MKTRNCLLGLMATLLATPLMASDSFGGIGVAFYQVPNGVKVTEVIPGTPASESKLKAGDVIIAVDGESLNGKSIEESKMKLRGLENKPLEITFLSNKDTLSTVLRRTQITVTDLKNEQIESWYGRKSDLSVQELETIASSNENNKQLVAVLQNGSQLKSKTSVDAGALNGIYINRVDEFAPKVKSKKEGKQESAILKRVDRNTIEFELKSAGPTTISVIDADGALVAKLNEKSAQIGFNSLNWNSESVPNGRYMVTIEHKGSTTGKYVILK